MDNIKTLYINKSYSEKQGYNVILTWIIILAFILYFIYYQIIKDVKPILNDWENQKCKPNIIPFVGILKPEPGLSALESTSKNFSMCLNNILASVVHYFIEPIYYSSGLITDMFNNLANSVNIFRYVIYKFRNSVNTMWSHVMNTLNLVVVPMQKIIVKLKDTMAKVQGSLVTTLYFTMGAYLSVKSFIGSFLQIVILGLITGAVYIALMWLIPFTWPLAIVATPVYVVVAIFAAIVAGWARHILNIHSRSIPPKPTKPSLFGCFQKNTKIKTMSGEKEIKDILPGDILLNNNKVTATFKLLTNDVKVYNLNGVIVTESHYVFHEDMGYIQVKNHPDSIQIKYDEPYVYCLNTANKKIEINDMVFLDWDDIETVDVFKLKNLKILPDDSELSDIHKYLDYGFDGEHTLELIDGNSIKIKNIVLNDQLSNGERVVGIVKIDLTDIASLKKFLFKNNIELISTDNIDVMDTYLAEYNEIIDEMEIDKNDEDKYLYNILTDTGEFTIKGIKVGDYNTAIEKIIDLRNEINDVFSK